MIAAIVSALSVVGVWFGVHTLYVVAMAAKEAYVEGRLTLYWKVMLLPAIVTGVILDITFQYTFGWIMFLETPFRGGIMFSGRVKHHFRDSTGWGNTLARFFAKNLNVFHATHITPHKG
jgi:hypothetical protein